MSSNDNVMWTDVEYTLISVTKTVVPAGMEGDSWYEYILGNGNSRLVCQRRGTLAQVTEHAEGVATDLNSRRGLKKFKYGRQAVEGKH